MSEKGAKEPIEKLVVLLCFPMYYRKAIDSIWTLFATSRRGQPIVDTMCMSQTAKRSKGTVTVLIAWQPC